jgi:long-chain fatty acid transport protein
MEADSDGNAYWLQGLGWTGRRSGITFGMGIYGQGGMGTEYDQDTFLGDIPSWAIRAWLAPAWKTAAN